MKKRTIVWWAATTILMCVAGALGFVSGFFVVGLQFTNDMVLRTHCDILQNESLILGKLSDSTDVIQLAKAVKLNGDFSKSFIINCASSDVYKQNWFTQNRNLYGGPPTKERVTEAIASWKKAEKKLHKLGNPNIELK
ncbi:MAG: hypothetical protein ACYS6I_05230 [Planctomycetota bacterium]|jgi:hypothetical protein